MTGVYKEYNNAGAQAIKISIPVRNLLFKERRKHLKGKPERQDHQ
jgi:hypothetical protein